MSAIKNVIVIGATGNLGTHVVKALQESGKFNVSILTRESSSTKSNPPPNTKVFTADYHSLDSLTAAFEGQDVVISTITGAAQKDQQPLIDAAINAGVKRFIPAEFGTNTLGKAGELAIFAGKAVTIKYLQEKAAEGKIEWSAIAGGAFLELCLTNNVIGFNIAEKKAVIFNGGDIRFSVSTFPAIGKSVVGALSHPKETKNKFVFVHSATTTQNELLALYEKLTGTKWEVEHRSTAEGQKAAEEKLAKGDFSLMLNFIHTAVFADGYEGEFKKVDNELLGVEKLDAKEFEEAIKSTL